MGNSANQTISIGGRKIGFDEPPFVIAEMSGNHNHSLERALAIVDAAAKAGVDAVKLQTYTADTMTLDITEESFFINDPGSLWEGKSLYTLYQQAYTPWEWHKPIFERCREHGILAFSSPFDASAVDFLENLNVPAYKIASFEIVDLPLIRKAASTGKPVIMSTGMATEEEIEDAIHAANKAGCQDVILLKCTTSYPADARTSHLRTIPYLRERFNVQVGLSDHTLGIGAAVASVALGATVIEKHFTLARSDGGVDAAFSLEPHEMASLVESVRIGHNALGDVQVGPIQAETSFTHYRRSLYITEDMSAGQVFTEQNLRAIRPGRGLQPKFYEQVLGKRAKVSIKRGTPLQWELME